MLLLCIADSAVIALACAAAWAVRRITVEGYWPEWPRNWESFLKGPLFLFAIPITLYSMWVFRLYLPRRDRSVWSEVGQVFKASLASIAVMVVVLWAVGDDLISGPKGGAYGVVFGRQISVAKLQLGLLAIVLPTALGAHRTAFRASLRYIRRRGWNQRHVAIVGAGRLGQITCRTLERNSWTGLNVAYFLSHHDHTARTSCLGRPVMGGLEDLERVLDERRVDAVYLAVPTSRAAALPAVLNRLERFAVDVRIVPDVPPRYMSQSMTVSELEGMPILSYRECPLYGLGGFTKRLLDILGAGFGIVLMGPLMLVVALLVRLSGPGPVMYRQRRVSLGGEQFEIYKFRSMAQVADEPQTVLAGEEAAGETPPEWTRRNDPRITPIGRWLRKTSLDELPQLFNVFKGEMSLVGPRPERPELIARFRDDWRGYMLRQHVKAGMTGWAQVNGLRGNTSLRKRLQYDLFYIKHWSLWFDLRILALTVFRGFIHRNAY